MRRGRGAFVILVIVPVMAAALTALGGAAAQSRQELRFAAVPTEKGGQDIFGAYDVVPNWPKPLTSCRATRSGPGAPARACSPRARIASSCCSAASCRTCRGRRRQAAAARAEYRVPRCSVCPCATRPSPARRRRASRPADGEGVATTPMRQARRRLPLGALHPRLRPPTATSSRTGRSGTRCCARPHAVYISPYDPEKHVWIVDDYRHAIFKFTQRRQAALQTIGKPQRARRRRQALLPADVHRLAARRHVLRRRRLREHARREVRQERQVPDGVGREGHAAERDAARLLQQRARHRRRSADAARVRQRPREPPRAGVRRERQVPRPVELRPAAVGHPPVPHRRATGTSGPPIAARRRC